MTHYVEVEVDLADFDIDELLEELRSRHPSITELQSMTEGLLRGDVVKLIRRAGCPPEILDPLEEWARKPMADGDRLMEWKRAVGVEA